MLLKEIEKTVEIFRFINQGDPVPHLPTRGKISLFPYYNPGHEIFIESVNNKTKELSVKACLGDGDGCSLNAYGQKHSIFDHMVYQEMDYTKITKCQNIPAGGDIHDISKEDVKA